MNTGDPLEDTELPPKSTRSSELWCVFDLESAPLPEDQLLSQIPEFAPAANLKDPDKMKASIEDKKARYMSQAALSPLTGRVVAVGIKPSWSPPIIFHGTDEKQVVGDAVGWLNHTISERIQCIGFNIHGFDLPFLRFRAIVHKVQPLHWIRYNGRANWAEKFRDLLPELVMGRDFAGYNLDAVSKSLGLGQKNGSGAFFWDLYQTDQKQALAYLENDLELTAKLAVRMGVVG